MNSPFTSERSTTLVHQLAVVCHESESDAVFFVGFVGEQADGKSGASSIDYPDVDRDDVIHSEYNG
ncbi:hypothetical protein PILCRDRAFT_826156 [Piloderma croceum F 1598]|uniref:Uncharacterized protein n=1 Tax=Piloderma croceum (strain F 1598) TaxID=765440 RepID=A0A0C3ARR0_PILCF|nr:hypothetical protein PILCRDRAFT_826156 [Piloderma croceum F 1598]